MRLSAASMTDIVRVEEGRLYMTQADFARLFTNFPRKTINEMMTKGRLDHVSRKFHGRKTPLLDVAGAVQVLTGVEDYELGKARKVKEEADKLEMENDRTRGAYMASDWVNAQYLAAAHVLSTAMENFPDRVTPLLVGKGETEMHALVKREMDAMREDMVDGLAGLRSDESGS